MQTLPSANAPQNPTNYIVDTVSGQHQFILQNLTNLFNERFAGVNRLCETILKQQNTLYNNHQGLVAGLQEMRMRQEDNHNKIISTLNERLPQLEISLASVSKNMDLLARGMRQIDGKVVPLVETTREMELTVREIYESVKDPRAFAQSSPLRWGTDDTMAAPEKDLNETFFSSKPADDTRAGGVVSPLPSLSFQPPNAPLPIFPTEFTRIFPPSQSYSHIAEDDLTVLPLTLSHAATPPLRNRATTGVTSGVTPRRIGQNVSFQEPNPIPRPTMFPSTSRSPQKRSRNGRRINASSSPVRGLNGAQMSPSLSYILGSDLSDLTDSDMEDPHGKKALVAIKRAKKSRRITGNGQKKETALVLYNPKNRALQVKKGRSSPVKSKRRYGARIARKPNTATPVAMQKNPSSTRKPDESIRMIGCDACDRWYHSPCVGLTTEQVDKMGDEVPYTCPACPPTSTKNFAAVHQNRKSGCSALRCEFPSEPAGKDIFFIESLLGRKPCPSEGSSSQFSWLVKFDGYAIKHCLWKPEATFPAAPLIERFYRAAEGDGIDSHYLQSPESHNATVLLSEAGRYNALWEDNNA